MGERLKRKDRSGKKNRNEGCSYVRKDTGVV